MSDLMPCQMCGSKAKLIDWNAYRANVQCSNHEECSVSGKIATFSYNPNRSRVPTDEPWVFEEATSNWNEMQTLIARGKLLDTPSPPCTKARL